jgi:hypothetical protein
MTYQTTMRVNPSPTATAPSPGWLTAVLRPAGPLDSVSTAAFGRLLTDLSATADMVVVDLDATRISNLAAFVDALWPAATHLAGPGRCLLLANAPTALEHAVNLAGVPAAILAADSSIAPGALGHRVGRGEAACHGGEPREPARGSR